MIPMATLSACASGMASVITLLLLSPGEKQSRVYRTDDISFPSVPVISLIFDPEPFIGKRIRAVGYFCRDADRVRLCLSNTDCAYSVCENSIEVALADTVVLPGLNVRGEYFPYGRLHHSELSRFRGIVALTGYVSTSGGFEPCPRARLINVDTVEFR